MMKCNSNNLKVAIAMILTILEPIVLFSQAFEKSPSDNQHVVPSEAVERLSAIYEKNEYAVRSFRADWLPDGSGYLILEAHNNISGQTLASYDAATGKRTELVSASQLYMPGVTGAYSIRSYSFSPDGNSLLLEAVNSKESNGNLFYWLQDRKSGKIHHVEAGINSRISPDGKQVLFTNKGNLYVYNIQNEQTISLTDDAVQGSLVYNKAVWSPDGTRIAFVQEDVSHVRLRNMLIPGDPSYPEVRETRYARIGGAIATLRVGVVDANGIDIRWLSIPIPSEGYYLGQVSWAGNSDELLVEKLSRFRDRREFIIANIDDGTIIKIFEESDPAWVVASYGTNLGLEWIKNSDKFIVLSEKDGWRNAFLCSRGGNDQINITPGGYDIIERVAVDESKGWFYFNASPENGTQSYLFRMRLDGSGEPEQISPKDQPGYHQYNVSPDARYAFHTFSTANTPPVTQLVKLPEHKVIRVLEDNRVLYEKTRSWSSVEFFQADIGNDIKIDGWMIKPANFDPSRKYPIFVYVYGEPHAQTVRDSWGYAMADYHRVIADLGYIVISMDNRGTPCPKGAAWRRAIAGRLGPLSTEEQTAALKEFGRTRPYADLSRVGIWGWSGGGSNTLNAMFRNPNDYHLGIAVVPKPSPELYNAWFQEIYMKTPEVNPEGYKVSAPINYAEGLMGNLLIITGTGETNTHIQIVEGLVDRLVELGKQFDYMVYPNRDHGLREGRGTQLHLRVFMARYILSHLPAGPA
jgi:dipeptidyl-peptidase-4